MDSVSLPFTEDEIVVDEGLGYPRAYAKLCGDGSHRFGPYGKGPPFAFYPYALHTQELIRAKDLNQMFPIIDKDAKPSANPNNFVSLLWKQLSHLGNAGFDPALFRVDGYGNVLYFYADHASPLSWDIDHWFPCSRGGRTVPMNLRLLQWQVCKKKRNKLEFLIPWWDLQLGISVNQFLMIFTSKNSDFRNRAFSFLFAEGKNEELNEMQDVESHTFPAQFYERKRQVGLAPAAIVPYQKQQRSSSSVLKPLSLKTRRLSNGGDGINRQSRPSNSKENADPNMGDGNPYLSIALARDSLRQCEDGKKIHEEIRAMEDEMESLRHKNDSERLSLQDLEMVLIKKRRRVEKSRRLAEAQSSYKELLEKMIRDAIHQNVVYKEQLRLNQASTSALMARLEVQRAMCDVSEMDLLKKHKHREEIEKQTRSLTKTARKRSRIDDDDDDDDSASFEDRKDEATCSFPFDTMIMKPTRKELREFLEEEQRAYAAELSMIDAQGEDDETRDLTKMEMDREKLSFEDACCSVSRGKEKFPIPQTQSPLIDGDDKINIGVGKHNVEKWLNAFLENAREGSASSPDLSPEERVGSMDHTGEIKYLRLKAPSEKEGSAFNNHGVRINATSNSGKRAVCCTAIEDHMPGSSGKPTVSDANKRHGMVRSASAGNLRSRHSSPSFIPAMSNKFFKSRKLSQAS